MGRYACGEFLVEEFFVESPLWRVPCWSLGLHKIDGSQLSREDVAACVAAISQDVLSIPYTPPQGKLQW